MSWASMTLETKYGVSVSNEQVCVEGLYYYVLWYTLNQGYPAFLGLWPLSKNYLIAEAAYQLRLSRVSYCRY